MGTFKFDKSTSFRRPRRQMAQAALSGNSGLSPNPGYNINRFNIVYDRLEEGSVIEDWVPQDIAGLNMMFRRFLVRDPIAGPAAEIWSSIPWSSYEIMGIKDDLIRHFYEDAFSMFTPEFMESIALDYIVVGRYVASLIYDESKGYFTNIIPQDSDFLEFRPVPIMDQDPLIDQMISPGLKELLNMRHVDPRVEQMFYGLPNEILKQYDQGGPIPMDPWSTLFVARKVGGTDFVGTSMFTRCIPFWAIEKALLNSTVIAARRRASGILHVKAGIDDVWEPDGDEMNSIAGSFIQADEDPVGAVVVTRTGVDATEIRAGGDVWKISDEWSYLQEGKMRALGLSEAFMSKEASYANSSEATNIFMEQVRTFRSRLTEKTLIKLATRLARIHGFVKISKAHLDHRIRIKRGKEERLHLNQLSQKEAMDLCVGDLLLPTIHYTKSLQPEGDSSRLDLLSTLEEKGLPVPLRFWAAAGGFDFDTAMKMMTEDAELRKKIEEMKTPDEGDEGDDITETPEETEPEEKPKTVKPETTEEKPKEEPKEAPKEKPEKEEPEKIAPPEMPDTLKKEMEKPEEKGASQENTEWSVWKYGPVLGVTRTQFYNCVGAINRTKPKEIWADTAELQKEIARHFDAKAVETVGYICMRYRFANALPVSKETVSSLISHIDNLDLDPKEKIWELFLVHKHTANPNDRSAAKINKLSKTFAKMLSAQMSLDRVSSKSPSLVSGI